MKRPWLLPLVPVYGAGLWGKRRWFEREPKRLRWPVVSVGSLSAGGAGKTPVVLALAKLLEQAAYRLDVLSRGYGRTSRAVGRVDPGGTAEAFGDEPLLLARAGLQVWVGSDRYRVGLMAEAFEPEEAESGSAHPSQEREGASTRGAKRVHLLDDGFQHRRLGRALDVVLLTVADVEDRLLPAGDLREPLGRLRAAQVIVVREEEVERLLAVVRRWAGEVPVWVVRRRIALEGLGKRPFAFCGIARPEGFLEMLTANGVTWLRGISFGDHHRYNDADARWLLEDAKRLGADSFVTTEKDAVKITASMRKLLQEVGPVAVARLTVTFLEEEDVVRELAARVE